MSASHRHPTDLSPADTRRLTAQSTTYPMVGVTRGAAPDGWDAFEQSARIGAGQSDFRVAVRAMLGWQIQLRTGIGVAASSPRVHPAAVAVLRLGVGPVAITAPVRVVYVVDEPDRAGFAYGTLPGHPESGEELFSVRLHADEVVTATVRAVSQPASRVARLAPPLTRTLQRWMAGRYLAALRP